MSYENIIYFTNGASIHQYSDTSLVRETMKVVDWSKGSIVLDNRNQVLVPKKNIRNI